MAREQQFVARDFMGLGNMGDMKEKGESKENGMSLSLHEVDLGHLSGASASINNGILFNSMAFAGLKHPLRNRATAFQHLHPSGNVHEEKFVEQSAESTPERSYSTFPHPVQAWWQGDPSVKCVSTAGDDHGAKSQIVGGFGGLLPKNILSLPTPNLHTHTGFSEEMQLRMLPSKPSEKNHSAPLTIFYGGNVNIFNDISAEKAQAIMLLASTGSLPGMASADVPRTGPVNLAMTSATAPNTNAVNVAMASASVPNISAINLASRTQMDQKNCFQVENSNQARFGNATMQLDFGHASIPTPSSQEQPVVPTALPQARKASLARFLEKRRERVHSKSPYPLKQADSSLPEERFSSSNDIALGPYSCNNEEKKKVFLPSWMERLPDYSDMGVKEDTKVVSV